MPGVVQIADEIISDSIKYWLPFIKRSDHLAQVHHSASYLSDIDCLIIHIYWNLSL